MTTPSLPPSTSLLDNIRTLLIEGRKQVVHAVNSAMVQTYWQIGRLIVEDEQQGQTRAEYGKGTLKALSTSLTKEFGKGFDSSNLRNTEESPNDFDKNHKFKVDAHLVM
ncbi:DUF1016 domain-containing protein [Photobacterium damselae subsp. damselae]|uniref:DUF1016 N-terminal domain-containing protein n=1 Tax=Photobacterium damselae TaxID=38293 RepID=UPI0010FD3833|nr:DUF1016 N-terminal domain-containing protein [Photobacterium damselae]TLS81869.1 DUF1016 domain-containing protein [Photobacterium damselae subsp. damselae]TLS88996.1 DUF1016 domain-containing protein [Photobacterium damselae subsp. damselae]